MLLIFQLFNYWLYDKNQTYSPDYNSLHFLSDNYYTKTQCIPKYLTLLGYKYFTPMEYIVIKKKGFGISSVSLTC